MYPIRFLCPKRSIATATFLAAALTFLNGNLAHGQTLPTVSLDFTVPKIYTSSAAKTFKIRGSHLTGAVTVSANPPFSVSKDSLIYYPTLTYDTQN